MDSFIGHILLSQLSFVKSLRKSELVWKNHIDMARYGVGKGPLCHMCVPVSLCFARADFFKILSTFSDVYGLLVSLMIVATCNRRSALCAFCVSRFCCCRKFQICFS